MVIGFVEETMHFLRIPIYIFFDKEKCVVCTFFYGTFLEFFKYFLYKENIWKFMIRYLYEYYNTFLIFLSDFF